MNEESQSMNELFREWINNPNKPDADQLNHLSGIINSLWYTLNNDSGLRNNVMDWVQSIDRRDEQIASLQKQLDKAWYYERLYNNLYEILRKQTAPYLGQFTLRVKNEWNEELEEPFNPKDIICITTDKNDAEKPTGRKKVIYAIREDEDGKRAVQKFYLNAQKIRGAESLNMSTLCKYLDPLGHFLILVGQSTIINDAFYDFDAKNILVLRESLPVSGPILQINVPGKSADQSNYIRLRMACNRANRKSMSPTLHQDIRSYIKTVPPYPGP